MPEGTSVNPADLNEVQYRRQYLGEYIRESGFSAYMGVAEGGMTKPIHIMTDNKKGGDVVKVPIVGRLKSPGVFRNEKLGGREEQLGRYIHNVRVEYRRHGVELGEREEAFAFAKARSTVRPLLKDWSREKLRDDIIDGFFMVADTKTMHAPLVNPDPGAADPEPAIKFLATDAELDKWIGDNADRVSVGGDGGKLVAGDYSASLGNLGVADVVTCDMLDELKFLVKRADPHIRPIRVDNQHGREYFVVFVDSWGFRQLKQDPAMREANREARNRSPYKGGSNPIFHDGDLEWDGLLIREIPEIPTLGTPGAANGPGAGNIAVGRMVVSGAQAISCGWGMDPEFRPKNEDDYGHFSGVGITECTGTNKIQRNDTVSDKVIDNGCLTAFFGIS